MPINYEQELNSEQADVVCRGSGSCLVLAGAGTGKTRTIVYRVAHLIERGVNPDRILLVTFTNKAAKEMLSRIENLLGAKPDGLWGGTFHHVGNLILRRFGDRIGLKNNYTIMDEADSKDLLRRVMDEIGVNDPKADVIHSLISYSVNSRRSVESIVEKWYPKHKEYALSVANAYNLYEQKKRENNLLDFDDLLLLWLRVIRECPEVKQELTNKFEYILIDEYQDTNRLQGMIVEELAKEHKNILVVGDDAQSIYAFRAATVENIMQFPEIFANAKTFQLNRNYRSTQAILDLANASIAYNKRQFAKELSTVVGQGSLPELVGCSDTESEAFFVARTIENFTGPLKNTAVLFRAAFHAMQIELQLQKRHIPYIIRGGIRFFEQAHIKDVVAYLKVLVNPEDEVAWLRLLKLEEGVGDKTALAIVASQANLSDKALKVFCRVQDRVSKIKSFDSISEKIHWLLLDFYQLYAEAHFENAGERIEDLANLSLFSEKYDTLVDFLADATLSENYRKDNVIDNDYLVLSTIHQAKGLEWDNVFVIGLTDGQFPHYKSMFDAQELEEERRLFYVAVTRARKKLFLTYAYGFSGQPSLFMRELNPRLYKSDFENDERVVEY